MPQPAANQEAAERLITQFRQAQADLAARLAAILDEPNQVRQQARLRAQIRTISAMREGLEEASRDWLTTTMPEVYAAGALKAATEAGSSFVWTAPHIESVQALADTAWSDLAESLQGMEVESKRALRKVAEDAARQVVVEGRSVRIAADGIEAWMGENGIGTVTYRNGARHLAADYADTVARTTSANAYNEGTFTQLAGDGIEWVEVFDGPNCGWSSHDDGDKANGTIRTLEDAQQHSLSHPRCARSFSGRPDVTNAKQAAEVRRFTPEEQAQQAADEAARAASATTTLTGRARIPRAPREPRTRRASK